MLTAALALALTPAPAVPPAPGGEDERSDWLDLDREITSLASVLAQDDGALAPSWGGYLRIAYGLSDDEFFSGAPGADVSGFDLRSVRLVGRGEVGDYRYVVSFDGEDGTFSIRDAYASWSCSESIELSMGRFKRPLLYAGNVSSSRLLFLDRTNNGAQNDTRDVGVRVDGDFGQFGWLVAVQNGEDGGQQDDMQITGRIEYDAIGDAFDRWEGAYMAPEGMNLGFAVAVADDMAVTNGTRTAGEVEMTTGSFYLRADVVVHDEEYDLPSGTPGGFDPDEVVGTNKADTNPYGVLLSYLFGESEYELLAGYDSLDDPANTGRVRVGLNWYQDGLGHKRKWTFSYSDFSSDDDLLEGDIWEVGLTLGF